MQQGSGHEDVEREWERREGKGILTTRGQGGGTH